MVHYNIEVAQKGRAPGQGNQAAGAFSFLGFFETIGEEAR